MNSGHPLDNGAGKCPSIDYYGNVVAIAFQQQSGSNYTIQMQTYYASGSSYVFGASAAVSDPNYPEIENYSSTNANPNVSWGYNAKFMVTWEKTPYMNPFGLVGIGYRYGSLSYNNITFNGGGFIDGSDSNSINAAIYSNKNATDTTRFQVAWEQYNNNSSRYINNSKITISPGWNVAITTPVNISSGDGYLWNYRPSIIAMPDGTGRVCWIGDYKGDGTYMVNAMYRNLSNSTFYSIGYNVRSTSINLSDDNSCLVGWSTNFGGSAWSNSFVDVSSPYSTKTINTTGKDLQLCNGSSKSSMYVSSFYPFTAPYYFGTSNNLASYPKADANAVNSGKGIVVVKGNAQFSYTFGDLTVDNRNIKFEKTADTLVSKSSSAFTLSTEPFTLKDNSNVELGTMTGLVDKASAQSVLGESGYIDCKVELVDNSSGAVLGSLAGEDITSANTAADSAATFKLNTAGLGGRTVKAVLTVGTNLSSPEIYYVERYSSEGSVISKSSSGAKDVSVQGGEVIKSYDVYQNYPNPFNPSTVINYQLPERNLVTIKVYDILGKVVKTLVNEYKDQGRYSVPFDGSGLASGVYFYRLEAGSFVSTKKMLLLK